MASLTFDSLTFNLSLTLCPVSPPWILLSSPPFLARLLDLHLHLASPLFLTGPPPSTYSQYSAPPPSSSDYSRYAPPPAQGYSPTISYAPPPPAPLPPPPPALPLSRPPPHFALRDFPCRAIRITSRGSAVDRLDLGTVFSIMERDAGEIKKWWKETDRAGTILGISFVSLSL